jgi:hypothetical protein
MPRGMYELDRDVRRGFSTATFLGLRLDRVVAACGRRASGVSACSGTWISGSTWESMSDACGRGETSPEELAFEAELQGPISVEWNEEFGIQR